MLGVIIGTVVVIGALKAFRRARYWHGHMGYACGHGPGPGAYGGGWDHGAHHGAGRPRWMLRWLFQRLETTPGQEKAIMSAIEELRSNKDALRDEARQTRTDIADAVAGGLVDDHALDETFARHDRTLAKARVSVVEALKKTVEALDERQRKELASILRGRSWFGGGGRWGGPDVWA